MAYIKGQNIFYGGNRPGSTEDISDRLAGIEKALGVGPQSSLSAAFGNKKKDKPKKSSEIGLGLVNYLRDIGKGAISDVQRSDERIGEQAPQYAQFLANQVARGERSPTEASDLFADFSLTYGVPGGFGTASQLGKMQAGMAPASAVERYRPFQEFAARQLGIGLSKKDVERTEAAARALGKTSPEAFSQFLGQTMLSSPEYIRKTPLAFAANLPYGGAYGVGYQTPEGTFTGTYRFKPPTTVDYS